jgi:uncharacterized protein (DUF433 family)
MGWRERLSVDPNVCHGKGCVKGTRVVLSVVLDNLAAELTPEEITNTWRGAPRTT